MKYRDLKGLCKKCLGCNKLEDTEFTGVYRCEYATDKQIDIEEIRKENKNGFR